MGQFLDLINQPIGMSFRVFISSTNSISPSILMCYIPWPIGSLQFIPFPCFGIKGSQFCRHLTNGVFYFLHVFFHQLVILLAQAVGLGLLVVSTYIYGFNFHVLNQQNIIESGNFQKYHQSLNIYIRFIDQLQSGMEIEEYKFIYEDLKQQIKEIPHLQQLLRLAQKSTRKLQCINLYSISDKRDFDLELEEQAIMEQVISLYQKIKEAGESPSSQFLKEINEKMATVKNKNIETFDLLNRQDELLTEQIELAQYFIEEEHHDNEIKQQDEYQDQYMKDSNNGNATTAQKVNALKKEIDDISMKILKINNGRGKWYQSDHNDFVKIYNKCGGNGKRIIEEGVKVLGMKNTEIMDHLQIYENYLQLEKEKKLISEEYKQIKIYEKLEEDQKKERQIKEQQQKKKIKKEKEMQEIEKKKELIQQFKEKRQEQKIKMIQQHEKKQKQKIMKIPVPPYKKKEIIERNQRYILQKQNSFKKGQQKVDQKNANLQPTKTGFSKGKQPIKNKASSLQKQTKQVEPADVTKQ